LTEPALTDLLAVIPARAGSKGIPGKALRTVGGVPLILRTLRIVEAADVAARIVVSSNCAQVKAFCELRGYEVIDRPEALADDETPVIEAARHAVSELDWRGTHVALFQPTCPLLKAVTVRHFVTHLENCEWLICESADPHIHRVGGRLVTPRINRQALGDVTQESGAIQAMTTEALFKHIAPLETFRIEPRQALDIDTHDDLAQAEWMSRRARIHFIVAMGEQVGTGHFHRSFALAQALSHHDVTWEWRGEPPPWAEDRVRERWTQGGNADVTIFDCLTPSDVDLWQQRNSKHVIFEDDAGTPADLRINELLDPADLRHAILREEFLHLPERFHADACHRTLRALVTFGGTDPARLGTRFRDAKGANIELRVIEPGSQVDMASAMRHADLVVTSQGRTVLEAAACGTPCVSIAANERETRHIRIPGVTYLGLHTTVTDDLIRHAVLSTLGSQALRQEMADTAGRVIDGRGLERVVRRVEDLLI
jgi:CMP-N-acetylneuraminic acid synthetase